MRRPYSPVCKGVRHPSGRGFKGRDQNLRLVSSDSIRRACDRGFVRARAGWSSRRRTVRRPVSGARLRTSGGEARRREGRRLDRRLLSADRRRHRRVERSELRDALDRNRDVEGVARRQRRRVARGLGLRLGRRRACRTRRCVTSDPFSPLQWYAQRIKAPDAHTITGGSPKVLVGVIDTGIDAGHPDLNDNVDASRSVSCVGGAPNQDPAAWNDDSGHGTNVAGRSPPRRTARASSASRRTSSSPSSRRASTAARATSSSPTRSSARSSGRPNTASTSRTTATRSTARSPPGRPRSAQPTPRSGRS